MRAALCALMITLFCAAGPAAARNGETGILIAIRHFEFVEDDSQHQQLVICSEDLERIRHLLEEGYETSIYLPGYGVFDVEENADGSFQLYQNSIGIQARECHETWAC